MGFFALLAIAAAFQLVAGLLQRTTKPKAEQQPALPSHDGSKAIPVIFGECLITDAFLLDYLDFRVEPIKIRNPATFFITTVTTGYRYYLGIVFGLGWAKGTPQDSNNPQLKAITIDNREIYFAALHAPTAAGYDDVDINKPSWFGSEKQEGGVVARVRYYDGSDPAGLGGFQKDPDPYWEAQRALTMPDYKHLAYAVWNGPSSGISIGGRRSGYIGNSARLWPIGFKLVRLPGYLGTAGTRNIGDTPSSSGDHANPIECLYEVLTDADYGAGISTGEIDTTSWNTAINAVWAEGLAFSYLWNTASAVEDMVAEILRHVDGVIWTDLATGKIKIKLAREEDTTSSPVYTNNDFAEIQSFSRGSWEDTRNEIKIAFPDHTKVDLQTTTISHYEIANFGIQGESKTEPITFLGCPSTALAVRLAAREGRILSRPYARLKATMDRQTWAAAPSDLFKFTWPEQGISNMVFRITGLKFGTIADGTIEVTAVEDVFRLGEATFGAPATTVWTDPLGGGAVDATAAVSEIPYFVQRDDLSRIMGVAARPDAAHVAYDGAIDGEAEMLEVDFTPSGLTTATYPQLSTTDYDTTGFTVNALTDGTSVVAGNSTEITNGEAGLAILGDPSGTHEWIGFEFVSGTTTLTLNNVWRGILDTPPREWPAGTRIWFWSVASCPFVNPLSSGQSVNFEALTRTFRDQLTSAEATDHNYTIQRRAFRPLPPYYVLMGGSYANEQQNTGDVVFTWREHSRISLLSVIKQSGTDEDPEAGTTYELDIYNATLGTPVLLRNVTGLTSPTYTYTNSDELTDLGSATLATRLRVDFYSKRETLRSLYAWQRHVFRVDPGSFNNSDWILPAQIFDDSQASFSVTGWDELGTQIFS